LLRWNSWEEIHGSIITRAASARKPEESFVVAEASNLVARREDFVFRCRRKVVSCRGSFPRNPVGGRPFELDRRDSLGCGRKPALRSAGRNGNPRSALVRDASELCKSLQMEEWMQGGSESCRCSPISSSSRSKGMWLIWPWASYWGRRSARSPPRW